jgi:type II secretory pathway component PulK
MRKGFSLLTAIIFLVLIATISAISISLSTKSAKQTGDVFLKSQAQLLLRSGTEYAMLALSGTEYNATNCLNSINMTYNNSFDINVTISYIGKDIPSSCINILENNISTSDSNRTVIIDTFVSTKPGITTEHIKLHRRTIQKP